MRSRADRSRCIAEVTRALAAALEDAREGDGEGRGQRRPEHGGGLAPYQSWTVEAVADFAHDITAGTQPATASHRRDGGPRHRRAGVPAHAPRQRPTPTLGPERKAPRRGDAPAHTRRA